MVTEPNRDESIETPSAPPDQPKRDIYPEVNERFKGMIIWLGLGFVLMVFVIQKFSGYS